MSRISSSAVSPNPPAIRSSLNLHKKSKWSIKVKSKVFSESASCDIIPSMLYQSVTSDISIIYLSNTTCRTPNLHLLPSKRARNSNRPSRMTNSAISKCTKNLWALSITLLSSHDPISRLPYPNSPSSTPIPRIHTSKPRYTSYDTANPPATTALSIDVQQQSRLPTLSAIPTRISLTTKTTESLIPAMCLLSTAAL